MDRGWPWARPGPTMDRSWPWTRPGLTANRGSTWMRLGPTADRGWPRTCAKHDPGDPEICANGSLMGTDNQCPVGSDETTICANGNKVCHVATCPGGPVCPVCGNGLSCCPGDGSCETPGPPTSRACAP